MGSPTEYTVSSAAQDFTVLPLLRKPISTVFPRETTHYLYLKPHTPRIPTIDTSRQVFLVNLPIDATAGSVKKLFAEEVGGGRVESVKFDEHDKSRAKGIAVASEMAVGENRGSKRKRQDEEAERGEDGEEEGRMEMGALPSVWPRELRVSGSSAVVTFVDEASMELALKSARKFSKRVAGQRMKAAGISWKEEGKGAAPALGEKRYLTHHRLRYPDHAVLQKSVNEYMAAFNARESTRSKELARRRAEPDEDGFVTVTRGGRNGPAREEDAKLKAEELKEREKKRVGGDFYRFQNREKRKEVARDLVKEFEKDRERVEEMRRRKGRLVPEV